MFAIWDLENDPAGNVQHIAEHGIVPSEVEEVFESIEATGFSRRSNRPVVFGYTAAGRFLKVVFEWVDDETVYPITAYEVREPF